MRLKDYFGEPFAFFLTTEKEGARPALGHGKAIEKRNTQGLFVEN
ncbi:hypothetical protein C900_01355 [Fulvivirga imtechensis AK7]|uniref:Uncharacterized protein n=1 Tax=Fulvivirga imtechensis AK7 TaxID=1237149 RepID=L8JYB4_9BACT|nr:hypothetical protein C900_01355 [Fulvivirga imtechensis AK7]